MYDNEWKHIKWSSNHPLLGSTNSETERLVNSLRGKPFKAYYSLEVELGYLGVSSLDVLSLPQLRDMVIDIRKFNDL
jgi:hypothetical protein